jgi:outer membrane protein assembly factor BamB
MAAEVQHVPVKTRRAFMAILLAAIAGACGTSAASPSQTTGPGPSGAPASTSPSAVESPSAGVLGATASPAASPTLRGLDANDWPEYHLDALRTGDSKRFPAITTPLSIAWTTHLDGAVYAEPLVVHSRLIVATEGDSVYSFNPSTGTVDWVEKLGTPVRRSTLPCGDIDPLGITGTPAYDASTNAIFAVAEITGPHHVLFALDADAGTILWSRTVDLPGDKPVTHQQRPALAVANGYVYIGFGGLAGDCGQYTGKVVGVPVTGQGDTIAYRVPVAREGAVWATGGPVVDSDGNLYISTGNGSSTTKYDGSDSVIELSPDLKPISYFAPSVWARDNATDADLGSMSPVLLPGGLVFIAGKNGSGYVLRQGDLGGIGGQVSTAGVCRGFGAAGISGGDVFVPCANGIMRLSVSSGGAMKALWQTKTGASGPPVIGGGAVWTVNTSSGTLYALDPASGDPLDGISLGGVPHFVSPTLWRGLVFVGTNVGIAAVNG